MELAVWQKTRRVAVRHVMGVAYSGGSRGPDTLVRAQVRRVAMWAAADVRRRIQEWSEPLIGPNKSAGASPAWYRPIADAPPPVWSGQRCGRVTRRCPGAGGPGLRCLVVTTSLDVGGMEEVVAFLGASAPRPRVPAAVLRVTASPSARAGGCLARMLQSSGV